MGVASPDSKTIGIIRTKVYTITCCILFETAEIDNPIPMQLVINIKTVKYSVNSEPLIGILNQNIQMTMIKVTCSIPIIIGGTALPIKISVETVALLSKLNVDKHIDVEIKLDELDLTSAESKATYAQIKEYVWNKFGLKVPTLYIAQIKRKCGIELREHYNKSKKEKQVIPQCTPEKEEAIMDALRHFKMI